MRPFILPALGGLALIGLGSLWVGSGPGGQVIVATRKGAYAPAFVICVGAVVVILALILFLSASRERWAVVSFRRRYGRPGRRSR